MILKRIILNFTAILGIFFPLSSFSQEVALPDLSTPETPEEQQAEQQPQMAPPPEPPLPANAALEQVQNEQAIQIESIVKEVFSAPPPTETPTQPAPENPVPTAEQQPVPSQAEVTPPAETNPATEPAPSSIAQESIKPAEPATSKTNDKYPVVELAAKPEYTQEVVATDIKPIDEEVSASAHEGEINIEITGDSEDASPAKTTSPAPEKTQSEPLFSGLPKSMQNTASSSLVATTESFGDIQAQKNGDEDVLVQASLNAGMDKTINVDPVAVIPLDRAPAASNYDDDLAVLNQLTLPSPKRDFIVGKNVTVDRGRFNDPFYEELNEKAPEEETDLTSIEGKDKPAAVKKKKVTEEKPVPKSLTRAEFFVKDKNLNVEVKSRNTDISKDKKNAYDALNLGMYESAISYYKKIIEVNPNDKNALFGLATSYHKAKQYNNAKNAYLELITRHKKFFPAINNYIILVTERNPDDAIPKLTELWKKNPDYAAIPAQIANLYYKKNDLQKAAEYYLQAINLEPDNLEYKYNVAVILEKLGENKMAARYYKNLLDEAAKGKELPENPLTIRDRFFFLMSDKS